MIQKQEYNPILLKETPSKCFLHFLLEPCLQSCNLEHTFDNLFILQNLRDLNNLQQIKALNQISYNKQIIRINFSELHCINQLQVLKEDAERNNDISRFIIFDLPYFIQFPLNNLDFIVTSNVIGIQICGKFQNSKDFFEHLSKLMLNSPNCVSLKYFYVGGEKSKFPFRQFIKGSLIHLKQIIVETTEENSLFAIQKALVGYEQELHLQKLEHFSYKNMTKEFSDLDSFYLNLILKTNKRTIKSLHIESLFKNGFFFSIVNPQYLVKLENLHIRYDQEEFLKREINLKNFFEGLKKVHKQKESKLSLNLNCLQLHEDIKNDYSSLRKFKKISLKSLIMTNQTAKLLGKTLSKSIILTDLTIKANSQSQFLLYHVLSSNFHLEKLSISFSFNSKGIFQICKQVQYQKRLQVLKLQMFSNIEWSTLLKIANIFQNNQTIRRLQLVLNNNILLSDFEQNHFPFKHFLSLQKLELFFNSDQNTNNCTLKRFLKQIAEETRILSLSINIPLLYLETIKKKYENDLMILFFFFTVMKREIIQPLNEGKKNSSKKSDAFSQVLIDKLLMDFIIPIIDLQ